MSTDAHFTLKIDSTNGRQHLELKGKSVHSTYAPEKEAQRIASKLLEKQCSCVIIFGAGLGWLPRELIHHTQVLVYEPDPQITELTNPAQQVDQQDQAPHPTAHSIETYYPDTIQALRHRLEDFPPGSFEAYANPTYQNAYPEAYQEFCALVQNQRFRRQVNSNTLQKFGKLWVRNLLRNANTYIKSPGVNTLFGHFQGYPVLVLAGGPSLDELRPHLAELRQRYLLVAVDTALRAITSHGLEPDLVVSVDPQYWNSLHLDHTPTKNTLLVAEPSVQARSLRAFEGRLYIMSSLFPLGRQLEEHFGIKGQLAAGGSVATSTWDLANKLGASEVISAGLDLSFPESRTHFHGSYFEENLHRTSTRTKPAQHSAFGYLVDGSSQSCTDDTGAHLASDKRMQLYAQWFETQATSLKEPPQYRPTAKNRALKGFTRITLDDMLKRPPIRETLDSLLANLTKPGQDTSTARQDQQSTATKNFFHDLGKRLATLADLANEALDCLKHMDQAKTRARLDTIDAALLSSEDTRLLGFVMEDVLATLHNLPPPQNLDEALERSHSMYQGLAESARLYQNKFLQSQ